MQAIERTKDNIVKKHALTYEEIEAEREDVSRYHVFFFWNYLRDNPPKLYSYSCWDPLSPELFFFPCLLYLCYISSKFVVGINKCLLGLFPCRRRHRLILKAMMTSSRFIIHSNCQWVGMGSLYLTGCISFMVLVRLVTLGIFFVFMLFSYSCFHLCDIHHVGFSGARGLSYFSKKLKWLLFAYTSIYSVFHTCIFSTFAFQEFKCEICGNQSYWGRRAFERHFKEWRHQHGMRCLGIPNTKNFNEITSIEVYIFFSR